MEKEKLIKQANKAHEEGFILKTSLENIMDLLGPKEIQKNSLINIRTT